MNIDLTHATTDIQQFLLALYYSAIKGNMIFFACSAWFMVESKKGNMKKLLLMWLEVWTVSVLILILVRIDGIIRIGGYICLQNLFPIVFGNNWYISCYFVFFLIYPGLNMVIRKLSQHQMLTACLVMIILSMIKFLFHAFANPFFLNELANWVVFYFWIAYIKLYMKKMVAESRYGWFLLIGGLLGNTLLLIFTNEMGLCFPAFSSYIQMWNGNHNLFTLISIVGLLILANNVHFHSKLINRISSLSMLVYLFHENILLRTYYRPLLFQWLYSTYGYKHILLWVLAFALAIFIVFTVISIIIDRLLVRVLSALSDRIYPKIAKKIQNLITKTEKALSKWA